MASQQWQLHLFSLVFVAGFVVWDVIYMRRLRRNATETARLNLYRSIVIVLWATALVACLLTRNTFFRLSPNPFAAQLRFEQLSSGFVLGFGMALLVGLLLPILLVRCSANFANIIRKQLKSIAFILPATAQQRRWWVLVSLTAGVCEEVLYRGYLTYYGTQVLGLGPWAAALAAAGAFSLAHTYQGWKGVLQTFLLGMVFMGFYWLTGSLLLSMAMHFVIDVRIILMIPKGGISNEGEGLATASLA